jgi:hypothetical protein
VHYLEKLKYGTCIDVMVDNQAYVDKTFFSSSENDFYNNICEFGLSYVEHCV